MKIRTVRWHGRSRSSAAWVVFPSGYPEFGKRPYAYRRSRSRRRTWWTCTYKCCNTRTPPMGNWQTVLRWTAWPFVVKEEFRLICCCSCCGCCCLLSHYYMTKQIKSPQTPKSSVRTSNFCCVTYRSPYWLFLKNILETRLKNYIRV